MIDKTVLIMKSNIFPKYFNAGKKITEINANNKTDTNVLIIIFFNL